MCFRTKARTCSTYLFSCCLTYLEYIKKSYSVITQHTRHEIHALCRELMRIQNDFFQKDTITVWVPLNPAQTHQTVCLTPMLDENSFPKFNFLVWVVIPNIILKEWKLLPAQLAFSLLFCSDSFTLPEVNGVKLEWQNFCKLMTVRLSHVHGQFIHTLPSQWQKLHWLKQWQTFT